MLFTVVNNIELDSKHCSILFSLTWHATSFKLFAVYVKAGFAGFFEKSRKLFELFFWKASTDLDLLSLFKAITISHRMFSLFLSRVWKALILLQYCLKFYCKNSGWILKIQKNDAVFIRIQQLMFVEGFLKFEISSKKSSHVYKFTPTHALATHLFEIKVAVVLVEIKSEHV